MIQDLCFLINKKGIKKSKERNLHITNVPVAQLTEVL